MTYFEESNKKYLAKLNFSKKYMQNLCRNNDTGK